MSKRSRADVAIVVSGSSRSMADEPRPFPRQQTFVYYQMKTMIHVMPWYHALCFRRSTPGVDCDHTPRSNLPSSLSTFSPNSLTLSCSKSHIFTLTCLSCPSAKSPRDRSSLCPSPAVHSPPMPAVPGSLAAISRQSSTRGLMDDVMGRPMVTLSRSPRRGTKRGNFRSSGMILSKPAKELSQSELPCSWERPT